MKGARRRVIELFLLVVGLLIFRIDDVSGAESFQPGPGGIVWQDRVLPLPKEMAIADAAHVPAGAIRFEIESAEPDAAPLATARELLGAFAQGDETASGLVVSLLDHTAAAGHVPEDWLERLAGLPNADQAYIIVFDPGAGDAPARLTLVGNTPIGMLYAARTLNQLILPSVDAEVGTPLTVPWVDIVDWPDLALRGEWGPSPNWNLDWYAGWKLNLHKMPARVQLSDTGRVLSVGLSTGSIVNFERHREIAASQGYALFPYVPHIGGERAWLTNPAFQRAVDPEGNLRNHGFCWSQPQIVASLSDVMVQSHALLGETGRGIEVWLTEGGDVSCHCEICDGENGYIMETRGTLEAWRRARESVSDLSLMVMLSQGTRTHGVNSHIIDLVGAAGAGISYYDGYFTYITDRKPMIFEELEAFARNGGRVDVVPQLTPSFDAPFPGSMPNFVQFRMQEFADKQLSAVTVFIERDRRWFEVNMAALGEYAWNAHGRSPHAFSRAYATTQGLGDPEAFADWTDAAGEAAWELATTRFMINLSRSYLSGAPRIPHLDRFEAALQQADRARRMAWESGDSLRRTESDCTWMALRAMEILGDIDPWMRLSPPPSVLSEALAELDRLAHALRLRLTEWDAYNVERLRAEVVGKGEWYWVHPLWHLTSTGIPPRLERTAFGLLRLADVLVDQALLLGIDDPRGEFAPVEIGEWAANDFDDDGWVEQEIDLTDHVPAAGGAFLLGVHLLDGAQLRLSESQWSETLIQFQAQSPDDDFGRRLAVTPEPWLRPLQGLARVRHSLLRIPPRRPDERLTFSVRLCAPDRDAVGFLTLRSARMDAALPPEPPVRVGVTAGLGDGMLVDAIRKQPGLDAVLISRPVPRVLGRLDVLLVPQTRSPGVLSVSVPLVRQWIASGKGVMFLHDAVGYREHDPFFPEIGIGMDVERENRLRPALAHALTTGVSLSEFFTPRFQYDHIALAPGPLGQVILENPSGGAGLIAGRWEAGRVVLNGMLTGSAAAADGIGAAIPTEPDGPELRILRNAIRWLAGQTEIPPGR